MSNQGNIGDVELTFIHTFCRGGNLKALMASDDLPDVLGTFRPIIQEYFGKDFRGSILADLLALAPESHSLNHEGSDIPRLNSKRLIPLPSDVYVALLHRLNSNGPTLRYRPYADPFEDHTRSLQPNAQFQNSMHYKGVVYATTSQHVSNSFIFFRHGGNPHAGQIQEIFSHMLATMEVTPITKFFCVILIVLITCSMFIYVTMISTLSSSLNSRI
ncbi:hypothetical protein EV401DRAFT_2068412 [Pisolithus croceorrhizus]|nr:hypothetical protein EV401DRAFT_2068412 [Pisolithus croceorrhizus]